MMSEMSSRDLTQLVHTLDARLALIEATGNDPDARAKTEQRRREALDELQRRADGGAVRLPYADPE